MAGPCHIGAMRRDDGADDEARAGGRRARPARPHDANSGLGAEAGGGLRAPRRAAGDSWARIARLVGVSVGSLQNWSRTPPPARTLVPVDVTAVSETRPAALVVVSPGGYRVEGLDVATVSALLRTLG